MRRHVVGRLEETHAKPSLVHSSLLEIARVGESLRLVTTNFDRLFLEACSPDVQVSAAPQLPVPRKAHWEGIVHLHGLIDSGKRAGLDLILTSADFGRAYLLDRWASRFITELLQNFHVLLVGYSINDPVMRYLFDALSAERVKGSYFRRAWALAGLKGREKQRSSKRANGGQKGSNPSSTTHGGDTGHSTRHSKCGHSSLVVASDPGSRWHSVAQTIHPRIHRRTMPGSRCGPFQIQPA
jgi:hypothetical protein